MKDRAIGPVAWMVCTKCGAPVTVPPGSIVSHMRRQGCVTLFCVFPLRAATTEELTARLRAADARRAVMP